MICQVVKSGENMSNEICYELFSHQVEQWHQILDQCGLYDIYHSPEYHRISEEQGEGQATLFVFKTDNEVIAVPLLLRQCAEVSGLEGEAYYDATSVYGYPGPISSLQQPTAKLLKHFSAAFRDYLKYHKVVTAFSRLNPLFEQSLLLDQIGQILDVGPTAAIDLTLPLVVQKQQYRTDHRHRINKARREGVVCVRDQNWEYFDHFIQLYEETMQRVDADNYYFFDRNYFYHLRELLGDHLVLFVAFRNEKVISGSLFTICNDIIQYHLSGTCTEHLALSPNRVILDHARIWGTECGAKVLHLGGGVGGKQDGLYNFKAGFSDQVYLFKIWRMIVDPEAYQQLVDQKQHWNQAHGLEVADNEYFPAYRAPTQKIL